jgi:hypothetical protein
MNEETFCALILEINLVYARLNTIYTFVLAYNNLNKQHILPPSVEQTHRSPLRSQLLKPALTLWHYPLIPKIY